ncbi:hypothetical protein AYO49_04875 [Verrucomicrobiaceae bacterium SCGC AG-212-N21]|nr:hypothetical protein AYO49_04875 [Verrucomicrobiaceae bacterium SCGC AG-212-N21]
MNLPTSVKRSEIAPSYPVLDIHHPACTARVALHGAHLMEWTPAGKKPVLYMSPQAIFQEGKPIRGGVPVCWPWFGPHETDASLPGHGFVRIRFWELTDASEDDAGVTLKLALQDDAETRRKWPHAFRLELEMRLGAEMHLALRVSNTGDAPYEITGALHTYLTVGDIHRVTVEGLDGAEYLDTVGGRRDMHTQTGDVKFDREVDRNYHTSGEVRVQDAAWNRTITVRPSGSHTAVVWNPWIEKSKTFSDLPDEAYTGFVCVETANAWRDRIIVAPGAEHTLATTVRVA